MTAIYRHHLRLVHDRDPIALHLGEDPAESEVEVEAHSTDLTEAWRELLSRLPNDVYAALKGAMEPTR